MLVWLVWLVATMVAVAPGWHREQAVARVLGSGCCDVCASECLRVASAGARCGEMRAARFSCRNRRRSRRLTRWTCVRAGVYLREAYDAALRKTQPRVLVFGGGGRQAQVGTARMDRRWF